MKSAAKLEACMDLTLSCVISVLSVKRKKAILSDSDDEDEPKGDLYLSTFLSH